MQWEIQCLLGNQSSFRSLPTNFLFLYTGVEEKNKIKIMPVATISSSVKVQERTFQAFFKTGWELLPNFSGIFHLEEMQRGIYTLCLKWAYNEPGEGLRWTWRSTFQLFFFLYKEKIDPKRNQTYCHSVYGWAELRYFQTIKVDIIVRVKLANKIDCCYKM